MGGGAGFGLRSKRHPLECEEGIGGERVRRERRRGWVISMAEVGEHHIFTIAQFGNLQGINGGGVLLSDCHF